MSSQASADQVVENATNDAASEKDPKLRLERETLMTCTEGGGSPEPAGGASTKAGRVAERPAKRKS